MSVPWTGEEQLTRRLHVLQYVAASGKATSFTGYGSAAVTLVDAGWAMPAITMEPVDTAQIAGTITLPAGFSSLWVLTTRVRFPDGVSIAPSTIVNAPPAFDHLLPAIPEARGCLFAQILPTGGTGTAIRADIPLPATDVSLAVPSTLPAPLSPEEGATGIGPGSELRVNEVPNAVYVVLVYPDSGSSTSPTVRIVSRESSVIIPDVTPFGLSFESQAVHAWSTMAFVGPSDADPDPQLPVPYMAGDLCAVERLDVTSAGARKFTTP